MIVFSVNEAFSRFMRHFDSSIQTNILMGLKALEPISVTAAIKLIALLPFFLNLAESGKSPVRRIEIIMMCTAEITFYW